MVELRVRLAPILQEMTLAYFPFGTGFGAFETAYYIHEPSELLNPLYLNQAHNDILQVVIEGGLVSLAITLAGIVWLARIVLRMFRGTARDRKLALAASGVGIALVMASAVEYPLRTPLFQMIAVWLLCAFVTHAATRTGQQSDDTQA